MATERDAHNNKWGGKNNVWGKRKTSGKSNNTSKNNNSSKNQYDGSMSKIGLAIIGGAFLLAVSHSVLGPLVESIGNAKDTIENISDVAEYLQNRTASDVYGSGKYEVDFDYELSADDVKSALEYVIDNCQETEDSNIIFADYSALEDVKTLEKKVIKKAKSKSDENAVTFVFINKDGLSDDDQKSEAARAQQFITDNNDFKEAGFEQLLVSGRTETPNQGYLTIIATYTHK